MTFFKGGIEWRLVESSLLAKVILTVQLKVLALSVTVQVMCSAAMPVASTLLFISNAARMDVCTYNNAFLLRQIYTPC
jgi:hypothetical protein